MTRTVLEDVVQRLESFGYTASNLDHWILNFLIGKTENYIKDYCHTSGIPEGLRQAAVDRVCGEFLQEKKLWRLKVWRGWI